MTLANAILFLLLFGQTETVQVFVPSGNYAGYGYVVRECRIDGADDDWGPLEDVLVCVEWYIGGEQVDAFEWMCSCDLRCAIIYREAPRADLDGDGDVDLADFGRMAEQWTGPQ